MSGHVDGPAKVSNCGSFRMGASIVCQRQLLSGRSRKRWPSVITATSR